MNEDPRLYAIAKKITLDAGLPYTDPRTGITTEKTVDEVLTTCVKCGHNRKDHYKNRGACKFKEQCLCGRYTGR
jgi:hypothetical protein